ncbi:MAG: cellulase family glycosylhydrolase [Cyclobacteriaceae bacterium]|nr:cellulase family glycosylhydrolase [Cyclobacteriaceae bacterium]
MKYLIIFFINLTFLGSCNISDKEKTSSSEGRVVIDRTEDNGYQIKVEGEPFIIKGAAGFNHLADLAKVGGNTIRTWHSNDAQEILDEAFKNGIYVILGIHLETPKDGADYGDKDFIRQQRERVFETVNKYKNHPALLIWALGNEVNTNPLDKRVWEEINYLAGVVKKMDPDHPTTTMLVPFRRTIFYARIKLTNLDAISFNSFDSVDETIRKINTPFIGYTGPVIFSEWGVGGNWEATKKTLWDAPLELNGIEKGHLITDRFKQYFDNKFPNIIGNLIFYWGYRQEGTETWFSIFTQHGKKTPMYYAMKSIWQNRENTNWPFNNLDLLLNDKMMSDTLIYRRGQLVKAKITTNTVFDSTEFSYHWQILPEGVSDQTLITYQIDFEDYLKEDTSMPHLEFSVDLEEGPYRLYAYIISGDSLSYTVNVPFYVLN